MKWLSLTAFLSLFLASAAISQTLSLSKSVINPGEQILVNFSGFQGAPNDWISIAEIGSAEDKYLRWVYTGGGTSGQVRLDGMSSGEYELRGYFANGSVVKTRLKFRVGNLDQNTTAKTEMATYKPWEKIKVTYSGLPGNSKDWISFAKAGDPDEKYYRWGYTDGKQSGTMEFDGAEEGNYEVRVYYNGENTVRYRYPFKVCTNCTGGGKKACRTELSTFYQSMYSLGICWGRLGSDPVFANAIAPVQAVLGNVPSGITAIGCLDFDVNKVTSFSSRLPSMTRAAAVAEIDAMIKEILASVIRARTSCDRGVLLESLFSVGIHIGASQAIANSFVCTTIPADWQGNLRAHLGVVSNSISQFGPCIPGVSPATPLNVPVGAMNAYEPFSEIVGLHMQVLWAVSLSDCCCSCP